MLTVIVFICFACCKKIVDVLKGLVGCKSRNKLVEQYWLFKLLIKLCICILLVYFHSYSYLYLSPQKKGLVRHLFPAHPYKLNKFKKSVLSICIMKDFSYGDNQNCRYFFLFLTRPKWSDRSIPHFLAKGFQG